MNILNEKSLKINSKIKINFEGGDLTSDAGLLLINEFTQKLKFNQQIKVLFKQMIVLKESIKMMRIFGK